MIIKGKSRGNGAQLGVYLITPGDNERVEVLEIRGVSASDVPGAVLEMEAHAAGTRCEKPLYHASINSRANEPLTNEQAGIAIDRLEAKLGFTGQPCVVVLHEKAGRVQYHIVWDRIDLERMRAIPDSHNYRKHEEVARELEREFGHERVQGAHAERDGKERPERTPSQDEMQQAERTGITPKEAKELITGLWRTTDSGRAFGNVLDEQGWLLAKGERRDFVVIDPMGGVHSLARRIEGATAKDVRERMADIDPKLLPSVAEAKAIQEDRAHGVTPQREQLAWEDKLLTAGLEKLKKEEQGKLHISEKLVASDLAWHEKQAARPLTKTEQRLMEAYVGGRTPQEFVAGLRRRGLTLARTTAGDIEKLAAERAVEFAASAPDAPAAFPPKLRPGELVIVNRYGSIRRLNAHKIDTDAIEAHYAHGAGHKPGSVIEARADALAKRPPEKQWAAAPLKRYGWDDRGEGHAGPPAHATQGVAVGLAKGLDGIAALFERGLSGDISQSDHPEPAPENVPPEPQTDPAVRRDQEERSKRRQELLREFGRELEDERDAEYERERRRSR